MSLISKKIQLRMWARPLLVIVFVFSITSGLNAQINNRQVQGSWQPPTMSEVPKIKNPEQWWPDEPVRNDKNVRLINAEAELPAATPVVREPANVMSRIKESASKELTGFVGSLKQEGGWGEKLKQKFAGADVQKMLGSLAIVLGGYFAFVWMWRRFGGGTSGLPSEVLEVVGQTAFGPKQTLQLVKLGTKLLLLITGPDGTQPIGEITDPTEVERIRTLCKGRSHRVSRARESTLQEIVGQVQSGAVAPTPTPFVNPVSHPQVVTNQTYQPPHAAQSSTSELERLLKKLTQVVQQNNRTEFEA